TAGGQSGADIIASAVQAYYEEYALRPLAHNYLQFESMAAMVARRSSLTDYAVLDSMPTGGAPTDARTQNATLAYYYLLCAATPTFLAFYGGFEPSTPGTRHWSPAATFDVGPASGSWSLLASGPDPEKPTLTYHVYQRTYANALVLYRPLSYGGGTSGTLND